MGSDICTVGGINVTNSYGAYVAAYFYILEINRWISLVKNFTPRRSFGAVLFADLDIPGGSDAANRLALNQEQSRAAGAGACALVFHPRDPKKRKDDICKCFLTSPPYNSGRVWGFIMLLFEA